MQKLRHPYRFFFFFSFFLILFTVLIVRLIDLQFLQGEKYLQKAEQNRFYTYQLSAERGKFLDRFGDPLVWNVEKYYQVTQPNSLYQNRVPITRDAALNALSSSDSASVVTDTERQYRYPYALAHTLGYVGGITLEDLQKDSSLNVNEQIGKSGLEKTFEKQLRGQAGQEVFEVNALGQKQREISKTDPQSGTDIHTTIDPYLSEVAWQALGDSHGAVVMTDAQTGQVLVLVSTPSFNPNTLSETYPEKDKEQQRKQTVQQLFTDPNKLFFDRAASGAYPPGSIFKIVTSLAGLESGKVNESTQVVDNGQISLGQYVYGNWYYREYGRVEGSLGIVRALTRSNDIFFYKVAEWTGPDGIATMARMMGLGAPTGIELPTETRALVPDPAWKLQAKNEKWFLGDTYHYGIGQGDLLTSPVQIAQMTQAVANHGSLCQLSLLEKDKRNCHEVNVQASNLELVLKGLEGACSPGGTAYPFFPYDAKKVNPDAGVEENIDNGAIVCKTGTAEFGAADGNGYRRTHGWFTSIVGLPEISTPSATVVSAGSGVGDGAMSATQSAAETPQSSDLPAGSQNPDEAHLDLKQLYEKWRAKVNTDGFPRRVTISVLVESDDQIPYKEGSRDAAPVAKKMIEWMLQGQYDQTGGVPAALANTRGVE